MADFPGLPAFVGSLADATPVIVGDGVLSRETTLGDLAAYFATKNGVATPLAQWNGLDDSQFQDAQTPPAAAVNVGVTSPVFTASSGYLTIGAASLAPGATGVWWFDGTYPLEDIEELRMFIGMAAPTLGDELRVGVAFAADKDVGTAFIWTTGFDAAGAATYVLGRADAPGWELIRSGAAGGNGFFTLKMSGVAGGTYPSIVWQWEFVEFGGARIDDVSSTGYIDAAIAPFTAAWTGAACNKIGLVIQSTAGSLNPVSGIVTNIYVKRRQPA